MSQSTASETVEALRATFHSGRTRPIAWRVAQLEAMRTLLKEREAELFDALRADLGKSDFEAYATETGFVKAEIEHTLKHLGEWMRPRRVATPLANQLGTSTIVPEPLGVALIIGTWNYPVQLLLAPAIGAIAAGNCAILKPSELAPTTSATLARLVPQYLDNDCIRVFEGAVPETTALLQERFDHIFFTGGGAVGRIVMAAAARHLTPVVLELGGKSPTIVDREVDMTIAARRIIWGKFVNAGQTCIAPDYILVHREVERALLSAFTDALVDFFGADPERSKDFGRIINGRHFDRLVALLGSGRAVAGGGHSRESLYIAPTVLADVQPDSPVMQEEIFGPILPVLAVDSMDEAIRFINAREKPLALYVFSRDKATQAKVIAQTSSGGLCVNDTLSHIAVPDMPFGGVGESGMGGYHGQASFDVFTHHKGVLRRSTRVDPPIRYPPYTENSLRLARRLL